MITQVKGKITQILVVVVILEALAILHFWTALHPQKKKPFKKPAAAALKGKIAIVLDDWGYNQNNLEALKAIDYPLTLAVLPNLPYSKKISRESQAAGFEVILHLPLEPQENLRLERDTILVSMDEGRIIQILCDDLENIGAAKGASNHMGSRATSDSRVMSIIFGQLLKRKLYFLDSYTGNSIGPILAHQMGLKFSRRDIFLDNNSDPEYIKRQIYKLKQKAIEHGKAIGIGHDRRNTLRVLREVMPQLSREGYKFVFVSELAR